MKQKNRVFLVLLLGLVFAALVSGCVSADNSPDPKQVVPTEIRTFSVKQGSACTQDGKPVVRLFSTTWCPHCKWIKNAFDATAKMYESEGKIIAYHWEVDTGDNTLTPGIETSVPEQETAVFRQFNPEQSIPTFVFGCKYYRVGNGYESQNNLTAEIGEFKAVIEELLKE